MSTETSTWKVYGRGFSWKAGMRFASRTRSEHNNYTKQAGGLVFLSFSPLGRDEKYSIRAYSSIIANWPPSSWCRLRRREHDDISGKGGQWRCHSNNETERKRRSRSIHSRSRSVGNSMRRNREIDDCDTVSKRAPRFAWRLGVRELSGYEFVHNGVPPILRRRFSLWLVKTSRVCYVSRNWLYNSWKSRRIRRYSRYFDRRFSRVSNRIISNRNISSRYRRSVVRFSTISERIKPSHWNCITDFNL